MHKYLSRPARRWAFLAVVLLLSSALFWVSCSEKKPASTGPEQAMALSAGDLGKVMAVQNRHTDRLMEIDGVAGTATGLSSAGKPVVKVYAEREGVAGIPSTVDGIPVEVEVTGKFYAFALTGRYRPVPIGVSVGNNNECAAGTIGCVVLKGGQHYILSNNHVLARENAASIGEVIVQPGRYDSKPKCADLSSTNTVANLSDFVPINFSGGNNTVDAAIALYSTANSCATPSGFYGFPSSTTVVASVGVPIQKVGRTSGLTTGTVTAINATVDVNYGAAGVAHFVGQIITSGHFSRSGDSGSLVVTNDANNNPVGLLFAGTNDGVTILNPINSVLSALNVTVCSQ